jgi:hypothetical protein
MMPSGGQLSLDYLDLLATHFVVDQASLGSSSERKREARRILDDSVPRGPAAPGASEDNSMRGAAPDSTRWRRAASSHG